MCGEDGETDANSGDMNENPNRCNVGLVSKARRMVLERAGRPGTAKALLPYMQFSAAKPGFLVFYKTKQNSLSLKQFSAL